MKSLSFKLALCAALWPIGLQAYEVNLYGAYTGSPNLPTTAQVTDDCGRSWFVSGATTKELAGKLERMINTPMFDECLKENKWVNEDQSRLRGLRPKKNK